MTTVRIHKGINFVTLLYRSKGVRLPISFELVLKTLQCIIKTQKVCWRSARTQNEMFRDLRAGNSAQQSAI